MNNSWLNVLLFNKWSMMMRYNFEWRLICTTFKYWKYNLCSGIKIHKNDLWLSPSILFLSSLQLRVLIHELLVIDVWKRQVFSILFKHSLSPTTSFPTYLVVSAFLSPFLLPPPSPPSPSPSSPSLSPSLSLYNALLMLCVFYSFIMKLSWLVC